MAAELAVGSLGSIDFASHLAKSCLLVPSSILSTIGSHPSSILPTVEDPNSILPIANQQSTMDLGHRQARTDQPTVKVC